MPGVVVGAVLTAVFAKYVFPYDWDWNLALVFGAIVTTTDPVAIVALLEDLVRTENAPPPPRSGFSATHEIIVRAIGSYDFRSIVHVDALIDWQ